jgi:hypothetical protein
MEVVFLLLQMNCLNLEFFNRRKNTNFSYQLGYNLLKAI